MTYWSSTTEITNDLIPHCQDMLSTTISDPARARRLDELAKSVSFLEAFVRGYERIDDPAIDTDDEILNWAFSEAPADFASAIWLLASGFYKASAASLRNALDIATASLYFQIRENTEPGVKSYNRFFAEWDRGDRDTPNWGEMKTFISTRPSVKSFDGLHSTEIVEYAYKHFKYLCAYTHTGAFANNGDPVTAINTTGVSPAFDDRFFDRGCELTAKTIAVIAILWQVVYPQIVTTEPLGPTSNKDYVKLFPLPYGPLALAHK
ncbi:hypothetical protein AWB71_01161 [Caballeronia peredens]|nr:hypothetical protein AWB71_01161 [Caballeronia peredens]